MRFFFIFVVMACQIAHSQSIPVLDFEGFEEKFEPKENVTYVINFWATWCKPCVKELPFFDELSKEESSEEIEILLVSLDMRDQLESRLIPFVQKHNLHPAVWLLDDPDANAWIDKVHPTWSGAIPATLFYRNGEKIFVEGSFHKKEEILEIIHKM